MLCVVDGDVVCEPFPVAEEIFFLKSSSSTVLDLYSKTLADGSSSLFFEDPFWWQHLPSLKPVGLSCLATTNGSRAVATGTEVTDGARSGPMLASSSPAPSASLLKAQEGGVEDKLLNQPEHMIPRTTTDTSTVRSASSAQSLIEYVRQRSPTEDHLEKLARVIGFDMNDLGAFREKLRVNLVAPQLSDILHTQDINVLSQRDLWRRGSLQPHLTAVVVETIARTAYNSCTRRPKSSRRRLHRLLGRRQYLTAHRAGSAGHYGYPSTLDPRRPGCLCALVRAHATHG